MKIESHNKLPLSNYKRILVVGSPGAGKTTFSKQLAQKLNLRLIHIDDLYWQSNWERTETSLMLDHLESLCQQDAWIVDGNHLKTLAMRVRYADLVIFLDYSVSKCFNRFIKRSVKRYLGINDNLPINITNKFILLRKIKVPWHIIKLIINYKSIARPQLMRLVSQANIPLISLETMNDTSKFLNS